MSKKIMIITGSVIVLILALVIGFFAYKKYQENYNLPICTAGKPLEIAEYIFEINQREFPLEQYQNAKIKLKNAKTLKQVGDNYYCKCDMIIKFRDGKTYIKELYFISANYSGNPMVMMQNQSFTEKAKLLKK
ncbi:hypothetical protein IJI31_03475 [bacterium]|nr:hypothetical protein [bacterium]